MNKNKQINAESVINDLLLQENSEKFKKLFNGNTSAYTRDSQADIAFCSMVAFRTGNRPDIIDEVYRSSKLYTEQWEDAAYRMYVIESALTSCKGELHKCAKEIPSFILTNETTGREIVSAPLLAKHIRENLPYILVRNHGKEDTFIYVYEDGKYVLHSRDMMIGRIKSYVEEYDETLVKIPKINETLRLLETDLKNIRHDELNQDERYINFNNGLLDLQTMTLVDHTPDVYSTIQIPCDWVSVPKATPVFDNYMTTLTSGNTDYREIILEFMGLIFSNVPGFRIKKALFIQGPGDSGKSQIKSLTERIVGKGNFAGIDMKAIEARFSTGVIYGTRMAGSSDMSYMSLSELKVFKLLTGGDSVMGEFKGLNAFEYTYKGLLWFCMNELPKFSGDTGEWVYDRMIIIKCLNSIPPEKQDRLLLDKMYEEREGIVFKAIYALKRLIDRGYRIIEPESVLLARKEYMIMNNPVRLFFDECMSRWYGGHIQEHCTTGKVYEVFKAWSNDNNNGYHVTEGEFRKELSQHLGMAYADLITRRNGQSYFKDYGLTLETKKRYEKVYGFDTSS